GRDHAGRRTACLVKASRGITMSLQSNTHPPIDVRSLYQLSYRGTRSITDSGLITADGKTTNHKRVLVTGGGGFLGSHLCDRLVADGCDVLCVDNFFSGTKDNIAHLIVNPRFELLRHDVTFPLYVEVDEIYNLACPASPIHYQYDPVQTTKTS